MLEDASPYLQFISIMSKNQVVIDSKGRALNLKAGCKNLNSLVSINWLMLESDITLSLDIHKSIVSINAFMENGLLVIETPKNLC